MELVSLSSSFLRGGVELLSGEDEDDEHARLDVNGEINFVAINLVVRAVVGKKHLFIVIREDAYSSMRINVMIAMVTKSTPRNIFISQIFLKIRIMPKFVLRNNANFLRTFKLPGTCTS